MNCLALYSNLALTNILNGAVDGKRTWIEHAVVRADTYKDGKGRYCSSRLPRIFDWTCSDLPENLYTGGSALVWMRGSKVAIRRGKKTDTHWCHEVVQRYLRRIKFCCKDEESLRHKVDDIMNRLSRTRRTDSIAVTPLIYEDIERNIIIPWSYHDLHEARWIKDSVPLEDRVAKALSRIKNTPKPKPKKYTKARSIREAQAIASAIYDMGLIKPGELA